MRPVTLPLWALLGLGLAVAALDWQQRSPVLSAPQALWPAGAQAVQALQVQARGSIPMPANTPAAHASSLVAMPADSPAVLMAFWFAGERESAADVQIASSWLSRSSGQWQAARFVANRELLGLQLGHGLRRLGNPVAWRDAQGRMHLFVVATGLGGWAAGRVLHLRQVAPADPQDLRFEPLRVLPLSWLWNTSHLVRTAPLPLQDGGMLLPLYFELGIKYAMAARFGPQGDFIGLQRISAHDGWLQPSVLMLSATQWLALMRDHSSAHQLAAARTGNAGQDWHDLPALDLDNPDASIAAIGLRPGLAVMAHNPSASGRESLRLSASSDGLHWAAIAVLARSSSASAASNMIANQVVVSPAPVGPDEFSYPALAWADGKLWVSYTEQRQRIAWVSLGPTP